MSQRKFLFHYLPSLLLVRMVVAIQPKVIQGKVSSYEELKVVGPYDKCHCLEIIHAKKIGTNEL